MSLAAPTPTATAHAFLHFKGDLDVVTVPWAKADLRRLLEKDWRCLILDFHDVTFVDSAGISLLAFVHHAYRARRGRVALVGVSMRVRRLLAVAGVLPFFELYRSIEEAAAALDNGK